ncbi:MAG: hypothetical protein WBA93_32210 [Microcoleaceae cyanobacterium]
MLSDNISINPISSETDALVQWTKKRMRPARRLTACSTRTKQESRDYLLLDVS